MPLLQSCGCLPIRGSSGEGRKGGASALAKLIRHCQDGHPAVVAVDGHFSDPIYVHGTDDLDEIAQRVETSLADLESIVDPTEAAQAHRATATAKPLPLSRAA